MPVSERIRELVKDPQLAVAPRTEALLYAAARAQLVHERLEPLLRRGRARAAGPLRGLLAGLPGGRARTGRRARWRAINRFATGPLEPDRTLLLRIAPAAGRERQPSARSSRTGSSARTKASSTQVAAAYEELARASPSASARSTPPSRRGGCSRQRSSASRTCCTRRGCTAATSMSAADVRRVHPHQPLERSDRGRDLRRALLILGCIAWAIVRQRAVEPHWTISLRHAMAEAGFRASATWAEFTDWMKIGR